MKEALEASTLEVEAIGPLKDNSHFQTNGFKDRETEIKIIIAIGHSKIITSTTHLEEELIINQEGTSTVDLITARATNRAIQPPMQFKQRLQSLP